MFFFNCNSFCKNLKFRNSLNLSSSSFFFFCYLSKKNIKGAKKKVENMYLSRTFTTGSLYLLKVFIIYIYFNFDTCFHYKEFVMKLPSCCMDSNCHVINVTYLLERVQGLYVHKNLISYRTGIFQHNHTLKENSVHHFKNKIQHYL